jgi:hypothetical protein
MSIKINLYINKNNTNCLIETIEQNLNVKIIDLKKNLLNKYFPENNQLTLTNITDRVYKDYGLLFFNLGLLPITNDNYYLNKFTIPDRTFSFLMEGTTIEIKKNNHLPKILNFNKYKEKDLNNQKQEFVLDNNDFPPLG